MKKHLPLIFNYQWRKPGCFAVLLCLSLPISVSAQSDTTKKIKEVQVNTTTLPAVPLAVPSQTISASDFSHYSAFNVADAIRNLSGVSIKDYGGIGGLKTISVRGLGANHTAVLFDGVQINDAENGQIDLGKLNLTNIQEITLYNGQPPTILQTARAYASSSVLSIKTIKPYLTAAEPYAITAGIKAGSFGLVEPYLQWQQRLSNTWSFIINSYLTDANGRYNYAHNDNGVKDGGTRNNTQINAQQTDGALYWSKDSAGFNLHINYYNSDRGLPGAVIDNAPPTFGQQLWNRDLFIQAGYEQKWADGFSLLLNAKFTNSKLHYLDPHFITATNVLDQHFTQREYYQSTALAYSILNNWEISLAADVAVNNMDADIPNFSFPTRLTLLNVLASNLVLGRLTLQGSLLYTNTFESVKTRTAYPDQHLLSPTLMATIKPLDDQNFQLRTYYKSSFRNPTFNDLYYGFSPNKDLKPEYAQQYDAGGSYRKGLDGLFDFITVTADAYFNHVSNKIVFIPTLYNGSTQNFGKVDIKGLDAGIKTALKAGNGYRFDISANYSYQQALNVTGPVTDENYLNQLPYIPKNTVSFNAGISKGSIGVYYNQVAISSRYYNNNNDAADYMPAYSVSDASVVYKTSLSHFPVTASAEVNNLFNKNYVVVQSYPMPGRSYRLSFQISI
ncbi:TonB-dependent receptor [Mucilaginibacter sp. dw_454]|uniref:TonB-dependent receptor n=1 Tax=Mucilaginibacter sp. dw_454 TaxID=2720079 RepID=UPI001BD500DD|nr:TonB-dependent receptor [Mucilaginibacter sp. dw_454]